MGHYIYLDYYNFIIYSIVKTCIKSKTSCLFSQSCLNDPDVLHLNHLKFLLSLHFIGKDDCLITCWPKWTSAPLNFSFIIWSGPAVTLSLPLTENQFLLALSNAWCNLMRGRLLWKSGWELFACSRNYTFLKYTIMASIFSVISVSFLPTHVYFFYQLPACDMINRCCMDSFSWETAAEKERTEQNFPWSTFLYYICTSSISAYITYNISENYSFLMVLLYPEMFYVINGPLNNSNKKNVLKKVFGSGINILRIYFNRQTIIT